MSRRALALGLGASAGALGVYLVLFPWLYLRFDDATGIFMLVPIVVAAALLGLRGGLLMGLLTPFVQVAVYRLHGHPHGLTGNLVASAPQVAIGAVVGELIELRRRLRRKQAELAEALRLERETRQALAEAQRLAHTGSFEWYPAADATVWSRELFRLADLDPAQPADFDLYIARIHPDDRPGMLEARARAARDGAPYERHYRLVQGDGTVRHVHARSDVERDEAGRPYRIVGTVQDVTARRRLEEQLAGAERLAGVGRAAGQVAAELGQPLRQLWGDVASLQEELARAGAGLPAEARAEVVAALGDALSGCSRIDRIVTDLEALVAGEAPAGPVPLARILDAAAGWILPELEERARLRKDYGELPAVACDEGRLIRAFCSLLRNAVQAFAAPGEANEIRVTARPDGAARVHVEIADNGCGIPVAIQGRIFDPFFTTRTVDAGMGLGLSVCRAIVRSLRGEITVESAPGQGSRFRVCLPVEGAGDDGRCSPPGP